MFLDVWIFKASGVFFESCSCHEDHQLLCPSEATNRTDEETSEKARVEVRLYFLFFGHPQNAKDPGTFMKNSMVGFVCFHLHFLSLHPEAMKPGANPWERCLTSAGRNVATCWGWVKTEWTKALMMGVIYV